VRFYLLPYSSSRLHLLELFVFYVSTLMRPAFSSTRQAAAFALLLLILLLSPALAEKILPPRREIYSSIWWESGNYPYFYQQFFQEKGDIDIAFMGESHLYSAFDTPVVQEDLSRELGRPAVARTFGWGWPGFDSLYFMAQDLLEHRKVRMLVIDDQYNAADQPHSLAEHIFRYGDDPGALDGLPVSLKASYYFASIVGMPRNLLSVARTNLPADMDPQKRTYWEIQWNALSIETQLGAMTTRLGFNPDQQAHRDAQRDPFVIYAPQTGVEPSDISVYSPETGTNFAFSGAGLPPMQLHFAKKFAALAREHGCELVVIHVPTYEERHLTDIPEPTFWPDALNTDVIMIGIPPATLFRGLTDEQIRKLYSDPAHFNENGQDYFTALAVPTLLKIYGAGKKH